MPNNRAHRFCIKCAFWANYKLGCELDEGSYELSRNKSLIFLADLEQGHFIIHGKEN